MTTCKPPAEIAIVDLKSLKVIRSVKSGHETEGVEFSRDGREVLVTNEGDDTVSVYRVGTGAPVRTVKLDKGSRPRGIKASPDGKQYVVTLENTNKFIVLDAHDLKVVKTVDTKTGPYGVAFGPQGKRLFVAAARDKTLQVFDGKTYEHMSRRAGRAALLALQLHAGRVEAAAGVRAVECGVCARCRRTTSRSSRSRGCRLPGAS